MKIKLLLSIFSISVIIIAADKPDPIEILYNNRNYIVSTISQCIASDGKECKIPEIDTMIVYQKRDIRDWKKNDYFLWNTFIRICWARRLFPRINSFVIEDSIFTKVLIVALTHSDKQRIVDKAYQILTKNVAFKQLQTMYPMIVEEEKYFNLTKSEKNYLIGLSCPMSTNDCTVLLSDSITPLCIRAKLGDTIAEANLLNMFDSTKNYSEKAKLVFELSEAGTKRSITHLIKKFNKPVFRYDKYGCKLESLRLVIIESFQRYYPKESLFNEEWNKMAGHERYYKEAIDTNKVNSFLNHIVHFFDETYNTKPEDDPPEPILIKSGDCGMPVIPF